MLRWGCQLQVEESNRKGLGSRLEILNSELERQSKEVQKASASVSRAEKRLDREVNRYYGIQYERDVALVESWHGVLDWEVLLSNSENYSSYIYDLGNEVIERIGLLFWGINAETEQRGVFIGFDSGSDVELNGALNGISIIEPHLKRGELGLKSIGIRHPSSSNFALCLLFENSKGKCFLRKSVHCANAGDQEFSSLREALLYVQKIVCDFDFIEPERDLLDVARSSCD